MKYLKAILGLFFILPWISSYAQFQVDGEFRTKFNFDHGYVSPALKGADMKMYTDQRSRLKTTFRGDIFTTRLTLQDARMWGSDDLLNYTGVSGNSGAFGIYEAWVELPFSELWSVKVGRQEWNYHDGRLMTKREWWTSGITYDGVLLKRHDKDAGLWFDFGLSYNNDGAPTGAVNNANWDWQKLKTLDFVDVKKKIGDDMALSASFILSGREDPVNRELPLTFTEGLNFNIKGGQIHLGAYYQHGKDLAYGTDGDRMNISAWMLVGHAGLKLMEEKLSMVLGFEMLSGCDYTNEDIDYNNTRHSFDLLYGARFPYWGGHMNHFKVQEHYKDGTKSGGYFDPYLKLGYKIGENTKADLAVFFPVLWTDVTAHTGFDILSGDPVTEIDGSGNPVFWKGLLSNNIDLGLVHNFSPGVQVKLGFTWSIISDMKNQMVYGYDAGGELFELGANYFGWLMLTVKPSFFGGE